jgi:hypothetical protein
MATGGKHGFVAGILLVVESAFVVEDELAVVAGHQPGDVGGIQFADDLVEEFDGQVKERHVSSAAEQP